ELCKKMRAAGSHVPILLVTGRDSETDKIIGLDAGADDYVTKPCSLKELSARLRALLRRGSSTSTPILSWGPLRLNPSTCEAFFQDRLAPLRPKEYSLLEMFMRSPKRVFSRDAILNHLWNFDDAPYESTIKAHIKGLRQHLKSVGAPAKLIESIYGLGYRLNPDIEHLMSDSDVTVTDSASPASEPASSGDAFTVTPTMKSKLFQRIDTIERAVQALNAGTDDASLMQEARKLAHQLAGLLGTIGFDRGTAFARQIEAQLKRDRPSVVHLFSSLTDLRQDLAGTADSAVLTNISDITSSHSTETEPQPSESTLDLLIVGSSINIAPLVQQTGRRNIRCIHVGDATSATMQLKLWSPDVLAIAAQSAATTFELLGQLADAVVDLPTLTIVPEDSLRDRVTLARLGVKCVLAATTESDHVLDAAWRLYRQHGSGESQILAVDDDPEFLETVRAILQPWGFALTTLNDATQAWHYLERIQPNAILLDIEMPAMSGIELCQAIRCDERYWNIPILILTALRDTQTIQRVFAAGADDYVNKPVVGPELIARLLNRLRRLPLSRE
ncbi:MAG: response regulator, partial [Cyanobacteria bacterium P01_D01_bin.123]